MQNTRIYCFYRELIKMREKCDPRQMLKYINPKEAQMIDRSQALHIRFRLGGVFRTNQAQFPPTIFYKIFIHRNMIDLNSFSPRDYTASSSRQELPAKLFLKDLGPLPVKGQMGKSKVNKDEWYAREDSNNWRPVLDFVSNFNPDKSTLRKQHCSGWAEKNCISLL